MDDTVAPVLALLALGLPLVLLARRLGTSALVSYLLLGALAAGIGLVGKQGMGPWANVGATILLFVLGLEFDLAGLRSHLRQLVLGAVLQLVFTIVAGMLAMRAFGMAWGPAFAVGACLSMSSTLVALRPLDERGLRHGPFGRLVLGLLLATDIAVAPLLMLISWVLPGQTPASPLRLIAGLVLLFAATWLLRRTLAARLMARIRQAAVPELEVAFAVTVALGAAWLTDSAGMGAAAGAFCAGLALGGGEHRSAVQNAVRPLEGLLAILFFAAIGANFDLGFVLRHPALVLAALAIALVGKTLLSIAAFRIAGMRGRSAVGAALITGQIGEFSFVLAALAHRNDPAGFGETAADLVIAVTCLSLVLTPLLVRLAAPLLPKSRLEEITERGDAVVVAGLGPVGNTVVEALHRAGCELLLVDRNEKLLEPWRQAAGVLCHRGRIEEMDDWLPVLGRQPRAVVLTFPVADTSALVAARLLRVNPGLVIIARSPYQTQVEHLYAAGVRHVICDEDESAKALQPLLADVILSQRAAERRATAAILRSQTGGAAPRPPA